MGKTNSQQKKKITQNYLYATLIGLLVVACAVTIALASSSGTKVNSNANISNGEVPVAAITYVVPMKDATVAKDYSSTELQYNDTLKQWEIHKAIDFKAGEDLQVYAVSDGTVSKIYNNYLEGSVVEINHANGLISIYKSLASDVKVKVGEKVRIISGPFAEFVGDITEVYPDKAKLRASVSIFGRETPVELEYKQIQKVQ